MANISKGLTFSSGDLVTAVKLNDLVDDASISDITEGAFAAGSHIITSSTTAPAGATSGHAWWDTTSPEADGYGILKIHDGNRWQSVAKNVEQYYWNKSGGVLTYGDLVIFNTGVDRSVTTTTSAGNTLVAGVVASGTDGSGTVADNAEGRVVRCGLVVVTTNGTVTRGDYLGASATAKEAYSLGSSPTVGAFGIAVENTTTNKWLVAMSGHVQAYVRPTTTEIFKEQDSTSNTDNACEIPGPTGVAGDGGDVTSRASSGQNVTANTWNPLTWRDAASATVLLSGDVVVGTHQIVNCWAEDIAIWHSQDNLATIADLALRFALYDSGGALVKSSKIWNGLQLFTYDETTTALVRDTYTANGFFEITGAESSSLDDGHGVWFDSLYWPFSPETAGTYTVKLEWNPPSSGSSTADKWMIANPGGELDADGDPTFATLGMDKPRFKVVVR